MRIGKKNQNHPGDGKEIKYFIYNVGHLVASEWSFTTPFISEI
jgi:hypothetical protein